MKKTQPAKRTKTATAAKGTKVQKRADASFEKLYKPFMTETDVDFATSHVNTVDAGLCVDVVFTAIKRISDQVAKTSLQVFEIVDGDERNKAKLHPVYKLLTKKTNPDETAFDWKQRLCIHLLGWGNHWSLINRDGGGAVIGLTPFHPDDISLAGRSPVTGEIVWQWTAKNNEKFLFTASEMLHIKGFSLDGIIGLSPILQMKSGIGRIKERDEFLSRYYRNNAQIGGVVLLNDNLTPEALERSRTTFNATYAGARNAGKVLILEGVAEYKESVMSHKDQEFIESSKFDQARIAAAFGLPLQMLNDLSTTTRSSSEQLYLEFLSTCLDPLFCNIENQINVSLFSEEEQDTHYAEFNRQSLVQADFKTLIDGLSKEVLSAILTPNESRARLNLPAKEGGDVLLAPVNMVPIDKLGQGAVSFDIDGGTADRSFKPKTEQRAAPTAAPVEKRSKSNRKRINKSAKILLLDAYSRIGQRERKDLRNKFTTNKVRSTASDFQEFLEEFYKDGGAFTSYMRGLLSPIAQSTASTLHGDVQDQLGRDVEDDGSQFTEEFLDALVNRYSASSRRQIEKIMAELPEGTDLFDAIEERLTEWENGTTAENPSRSEKESERESNRFTNALTRTLFIAGGVTKMVWQASDGCPICRDLDGKTVGIDESFVSDGDELPNGFKATGNYLHPPLHAGCTCEVGPA